MSFESLQDVFWPAIGVATVAYFVLGAIWYIPPVMGKTWARAGGIDTADANPDPKVFVLTLIAYLVSGIALAMLAVTTGTDTAAEGAILGVVTGVGFAVPAAAVTAIYDRKPEPLNWFWINGVFNLAGHVLMGLIIGAWTG